MTWNYLDFQNIFVNEIAGGTLIFAFLSVILIGAICAKFKVPNVMVILIACLWFLILGAFPAFEWCLVVAGVLAGVFIGWQIIKIFQR